MWHSSSKFGTWWRISWPGDHLSASKMCPLRTDLVTQFTATSWESTPLNKWLIFPPVLNPSFPLITYPKPRWRPAQSRMRLCVPFLNRVQITTMESFIYWFEICALSADISYLRFNPFYFPLLWYRCFSWCEILFVKANGLFFAQHLSTLNTYSKQGNRLEICFLCTFFS